MIAVAPLAQEGQARLVLRSYQKAAVEAVLRAYRMDGQQRQLVSLATGLGKTAVMVSVAERLALNPLDVVLVIAHVDELIEQAEGAFREWIPGSWIDIEKAERSASPMAKFVVGSMQTLRKKRLDEFFSRFGDRIRVLIIDEAHHATAESYRALIDRFFEMSPNGLLLGVTATPRRSDNVGLHEVFSQMTFHMDIKDAIDQGYLVPIEGYRVKTETSISDVASLGGDYEKGALAKAVDNEQRNREIVAAYRQFTPGKQGIVFAASVTHAQRVADLFSSMGIPSGAVWGKLPDGERDSRIRAFRRGDLRILVNYGILIEGVDLPNCEVVIMARPTKSGVIYRQCLGRGLRPHESISRMLGASSTPRGRAFLISQSPKPVVTVLDVVDIAKQHSLHTLPTLFGLPSKLDVKGRNVLTVAQEYEAMIAAEPRLRQVTVEAESVEEIAVSLERIDMMKPPEVPEDVKEVSNLVWHELDEGRYRINFPRKTTARNEKGMVIESFDTKLRDMIRKMQWNKESDPVAAAYRMLRVDPASVHTIDGAVEVRGDALGEFAVFHVRNGVETRLDRPERIGRMDMKEAFIRADAWIRRAYKDVLMLVDGEAKWRTEGPTVAQKRLLARYGVAKDEYPATRGAASSLIDKLQRAMVMMPPTRAPKPVSSKPKRSRKKTANDCVPAGPS